MTDETTDDAARVDRRTVLAASGASLASGLLAGRAAGGPERDGSAGGGDADGEPDVRIVDNSGSRDPVLVTATYVGGVRAGGSVQHVEVVTKGLNHPDLVGMAPERRMAEAVDTIDRLQTTVYGLHEIEASHRGASDSSRIDVGPNGAATEETVEVQVGADGSVSVGTATVCKG